MEAGFAIIILVTLAGFVLLAMSFIFWTSPRWTGRLERLIEKIETGEGRLAACISALGRLSHMVLNYLHFHSSYGTHTGAFKR